ncbi:hypothetical protein KCU65_g1670, partial [Aureobasidium melanogenum]
MSYNNDYSGNNDEYSSTGRQGGFNDSTTGSGGYGDSSYGNDNLSSGANPGSGLGRDQFNDSSNYNQGGAYQGGALGSDDIASRGNNTGSGFGTSSGRDTYGSSGDNYDSSNTGYGNSGNDDFGSSGLHHQPSATGSFGDDDLKPSHGIERDTHHTTGGNYPSLDDNYGSGATSGAGFGNKSSSDRDTFDDSSNTRFGSSGDTGAYSGSTEYGSGATGGAGFGNKSSSGRDEFGDSSDTRFGSSGDTSAYSGSNQYGSGTTGGAGYGNKSSDYTSSSDNQSSGKSGDSTAGKLMSKLGGMMNNEKMVEKGEAKREAAGAYNDRSDY